MALPKILSEYADFKSAPISKRVKILGDALQRLYDRVEAAEATEDEAAAKSLGRDFDQVSSMLQQERDKLRIERGDEGSDDTIGDTFAMPGRNYNPDFSRSGQERPRISVPGKHSFQSVFGGARGHSPGFDADGGFESIDEYLNQIATGKGDARLRIGAVHGVGDDPHGGFMVPESFVAEFLGPVLGTSIFMSRCDIREQNVKIAHHSGFANYSTADGNPYGFVAHWSTEGGDVEPGLGDVRRMTMELNRLMMLAQTTVEIDEFSESFSNQLRAVLPKAAEWGMERAVIRGSGVGQPLGFLTAIESGTDGHSTIVVAKEDMQEADTITYVNLTSMFSRMHPASLERSIWIAHPDTIPQLTHLFVSDGTTSTHVPVMKESGGKFSILTRPVYFSEHASILGDLGDISLVDPSQYLVTMSRKFMLDKSMHVGFLNGVDTWRLMSFMTGQPKWEKPYTPPTGQTQSWAVTLAERS
jgi:HK97 family phage major capsid protein